MFFCFAKALIRIRTRLGVVAVPLLLLACNDPCTDLARKTCDCKRTVGEKRACQQEVDAHASNSSPSEQQEKCCEALLDQCTCEALAHGQLAACNLIDAENAVESDWGPQGRPAACQ